MDKRSAAPVDMKQKLDEFIKKNKDDTFPTELSKDKPQLGQDLK